MLCVRYARRGVGEVLDSSLGGWVILVRGCWLEERVTSLVLGAKGCYSGPPLVDVGTEVAVQVYSVRAARRLLVGTFDGAVWLGGCSAG